MFSGVPKTLIGQALQSSARAFGLNKIDFLSVIDGMEQDSALEGEFGIGIIRGLHGSRVLFCRSFVKSNFGIRGDENEKLAKSLGQHCN